MSLRVAIAGLLALAAALGVAAWTEAQDSTSVRAPRLPGADPFGTDPPLFSERPIDPAQSEERWGWSLFIDQDSVIPWLLGLGGDQNYTMGVGIQLTGKWLRRATGPLDWLDRRTRLARIHRRLANESVSLLPEGTTAAFESHTLSLSNGAFTPRRIELSQPIYDDRPYASILAVTASHATIDPYNRRVIRTDLTVGVLGTRLSEKIQTAIHTSRRKKNQEKDPTAVRPYDPEGWPHQVSDGGEPTAKYTVTRLQPIAESPAHDVVFHSEASVGHYTNAAIGLIGRVGWLRSDFWTIQVNPNTVVNQAVRDSGARANERDDENIPKRNRSRKKLELYAYGAARARAVVFNQLLEGGFRHGDVILDAGEIERAVGEIDAGVTASLRGWGLTLALTRRTPEFNVGSPRWHTWGGVYIVYRSQ